jgi:hypothetical protein
MTGLLLPRSDYPPVTRGKIVLWGMVGALPFGGMVWQVYHYLVALRRLGFDVWYVEDSDRPVYDPVHQNPTMDFAANVALLADYMDQIGLSDRWAFRPPGVQGECLGAVDFEGLKRLYREADAAINLCGCQEPRPEHDTLRCRVYVETDPVENQVAVALGHKGVIATLDAHNHHFTYGENLGAEDCPVPMQRYRWRPTRPPVAVDLWFDTPQAPSNPALTTIAKLTHHSSDITWKGYDSKDVRWNGHVWRWSKYQEFLKFLDVPQGAVLPLEIATTLGTDDIAKWRDRGWRVGDASRLNDPMRYRDYIRTSSGEFTVAKDQYVAPRSGWFSDRSVCYLAAGRPVITQDTGFGKRIPTGHGLFAFSSKEEALAAIDAVAADYSTQSAAAVEIAKEYFDAEKVVREMLGSVGLI